MSILLDCGQTSEEIEVCKSDFEALDLTLVGPVGIRKLDC